MMFAGFQCLGSFKYLNHDGFKSQLDLIGGVERWDYFWPLVQHDVTIRDVVFSAGDIVMLL